MSATPIPGLITPPAASAALPEVAPQALERARFLERNPATRDTPWVRLLLLALGLGFFLVFLLLPLITVFFEALRKGVGIYDWAIHEPDVRASVALTLLAVSISVPLNVFFGLCAGWSVAKFEFPGKQILITLIDLPFSVSPVIAGLSYMLLFGARGPLGPWLAEHDLHLMFAVPGIVMATTFVTFPFVARELISLMQAQGREEEEAAVTLGATGFATFLYITLPNVRWGLLYGAILCNARAMGEFGAVSVVSGHIRGETNTLPLEVEILYNEYNLAGAFAVASFLCVLALVTLLVKWWVERRVQQEIQE